MAAKSLLVRIGAQIKGLESGLAKAGKLTAGYAKTVGRVGAIAGAIAVGGLALLTAGIVKSTRAAIAYDEAWLKASSALQRAGGKDIPLVISRMTEFADELQFNTRFTDDAILSAIGFASSIGISTDKLEDATVAAADLSAATGISLDTSLRAIAQAGQGTVGMLSKYGVQMDSARAKTEGLDFVLESLGKQMGGAALQAGLSFQARLENVKKAQDNVLESTGQAITQNALLNATLEVATDTIRDFSSFIVDNRETLDTWVNQGFALAVDAINLVITGLEFGAKALLSFQIVGNLAIAGVIDVFAALISVELKVLEGLERLARWAGADELANSIQGVKTDIAGFKAEVDATGDVFRGSAAAGVNSFEKVGAVADLVREKVAGVVAEINKTKDSIEVLGETAPTNIEKVAAATSILKKETKETKETTEQLGQQMVASFGTGFEAFVSGSVTAKDAFKSFAIDALRIIEKVAVDQIIAASAVSAAEGAKSQAGIPVIGPILAPLAFAAMFALGRSALTKLHEGTDFVRRDDLLRLPGMAQDEGIAVLREGESVEREGGGRTIVNNFITNTIGFPSRAQGRVYANRDLIPALKRSLS